MSTPPTVFISYSHDNEIHSQWVYKLACRLVESGVETILDQWDVQLGSNLVSFMEKGLSNSDRVLVICTDNYNRKSNDGMGGVGYEKNILTAELFINQLSTKFVPIIRSVSNQMKTPICLGGRAYIDFTDDTKFETNFKQLLHGLYDVPLKFKPELGKNPFQTTEEEQLPSISGQSSLVFFSNRFAQAFPGVRGIQWFRDPTEAVKRLALFFKEPFYFRDSLPIWWWRTGDMHIDNFAVLSPNTVLIDYQELVIEEIAAVNAGEYYQTFIYIKTRPSQPTGLYDHSSIDKEIAYWGYAREEFAVLNGRPIRRAEYDDGAAVIDGQVVSLNGEAELRVRYVTPYNLILAPHCSPINNNQFDQIRVKLLNEILQGTSNLDSLVDIVLKLRKLERCA
ncbi:MAG: toll/interleukin-1 receptor domain-containing protein [Betaproteobacteria bacterium]|nr:toll/interleukin-1 receptor domain-containing protein [Betaproteobacteria bacterium]